MDVLPFVGSFIIELYFTTEELVKVLCAWTTMEMKVGMLEHCFGDKTETRRDATSRVRSTAGAYGIVTAISPTKMG